MLATIEDALVCIVPAFAKLLPTEYNFTKAIFHVAKEIPAYIESGQLEHAEALLLWLLDTTESEALQYENSGDWNGACKIYCRLLESFNVFRSDDCKLRAEKAMDLFCKRSSLFASLDREMVENALA